MGYRKLSARPRHYAQAAGAIEDLKKLPTRLGAIARERAIAIDKIEIWFADEARIGQKNKITRRWAKRGTRPALPVTNGPPRPISSALSARKRQRRALILPACNTEAMNLHLAEIAKAVRARRPRRPLGRSAG